MFRFDNTKPKYAKGAIQIMSVSKLIRIPITASNRPASAGVTAILLRYRIAAHITQIPRTVSKSDFRENCHGFAWGGIANPRLLFVCSTADVMWDRPSFPAE
jgi:hypothetical protein